MRVFLFLTHVLTDVFGSPILIFIIYIYKLYISFSIVHFPFLSKHCYIQNLPFELNLTKKKTIRNTTTKKSGRQKRNFSYSINNNPFK